MTEDRLEALVLTQAHREELPSTSKVIDLFNASNQYTAWVLLSWYSVGNNRTVRANSLKLKISPHDASEMVTGYLIQNDMQTPPPPKSKHALKFVWDTFQNISNGKKNQ